MTTPVVFLDRDGVINEDSDDYIKSPAEWHPIPGSLTAIALLHQAGFKVVVVTNQSGIGRGLYDLPTLDAIHAKMQHLVTATGGAISRVYFCPHTPEDACTCRKPKPGLLRQFSDDTGTPLAGVFMVGDTVHDVQAAQAVGAVPLLVKTGKGLRTLAAHPELDVPVFTDLHAAATFILEATDR